MTCAKRFAAPAIFLALTSSAFAQGYGWRSSGFVHGFSHPCELVRPLLRCGVGSMRPFLGARALGIAATFVSGMAIGALSDAGIGLQFAVS